MPTSSIPEADGQWPRLLAELGGLNPDQLTNEHQPCPACGGTDRYRWDDDDGPGAWFCNQCGGKQRRGGGGTGADLLMRVRGWTFSETAQRVRAHLGSQSQGKPAPRQRKARKPARIPTAPPAGTPPPALDGAVAQYPYGPDPAAPWFWIQRIPQPPKPGSTKAGKVFVHRTWLDGRWHRPSKSDPFASEWPAPRPVFRLPHLLARPDAPVLIVEGEETALAAAQLFPDHVAVSGCGGTGGINATDWSPLGGRTVDLWPDADPQGLSFMASLAQRLLAAGCAVRAVEPPDDAPKGWDLADALALGWSPRQAAQQLRERARVVELQPEDQQAEPEHKPEQQPDPIAAARARIQAAIDDGNDGADLATLQARIAADGDIQPAALQRLTTELQTRARRVAEVGHEARALLEEEDRRELGAVLTPEYLLPAAVAAAVQSVTRYLPGDGPSRCLPFLVAVAGLCKIGTIIEGIPAAGYRVPVNLYGCLVGRSGAKKSPTDRRLVVEPLQPIIDDLNRANRQRREEWVQQCADTAKGQPKPLEPRPVRVTASDFTGEALAEQLQQQEASGHGLLVHRDELAGLFGGLNAYRNGRGADEQQLLEAFDGRGLTSLRVRGDRVYGRCQLSIWGGTQHEVLRDLVANGDATGLWARFLFVPLPETVVPLPVEASAEELAEVDAAMLALQHITGTVYRLPPLTYRLTAAATAAFVRYEAARQAEALKATLGAASALFGKSAGKVLRLAGAIHLVRIGVGEASTDEPIDEDLIERASQLVNHLDGWALGLHSSVAAGGVGQIMRVVHRLATNAGGWVRWKEISTRLTKTQRGEIDSAAVTAAMEALADAGYGEIQRGNRGALGYKALKPLP